MNGPAAAARSDGNRNVRKKPDDRRRPDEYAPKPTLYSSVVQTEHKLRQISLGRSDPPKPAEATNKASVREVNFPLKKHMYDYSSMVDVGLNSGPVSSTKPKPRKVHSTRQPEPKLSDYYQPNFSNNAQWIQMKSVTTAPELTVQYDGLAVSRLINEIDDLVFQLSESI